jgi:hypothetical protein
MGAISARCSRGKYGRSLLKMSCSLIGVYPLCGSCSGILVLTDCWYCCSSMATNTVSLSRSAGGCRRILLDSGLFQSKSW